MSFFTSLTPVLLEDRDYWAPVTLSGSPQGFNAFVEWMKAPNNNTMLVTGESPSGKRCLGHQAPG